VLYEPVLFGLTEDSSVAVFEAREWSFVMKFLPLYFNLTTMLQLSKSTRFAFKQ
jgi:hypothetical protein